MLKLISLFLFFILLTSFSYFIHNPRDAEIKQNLTYKQTLKIKLIARIKINVPIYLNSIFLTIKTLKYAIFKRSYYRSYMMLNIVYYLVNNNIV